MFYVNSENRESWITVHHRAEEETSIICVANLHSLPWKITSSAPKIRTTLKRRWIFKRASGNRYLHDAGKSRNPRTAAAILCQYVRGQSPTTEKDKRFRKDRISIMITGWHTWKRHYSKRLRHHDKGTAKEREQRNGRENSRLKMVALHLPQELQICELGDTHVQSEDHTRMIPPRMMNHANFLWWTTQKFFTRVQFIYIVDWARYHYSFAQAGLVAKRKEANEVVRWCTHSYIKKTNISFVIQLIYNGRCTICLDKMPAKRR